MWNDDERQPREGPERKKNGGGEAGFISTSFSDRLGIYLNPGFRALEVSWEKLV